MIDIDLFEKVLNPEGWIEPPDFINLRLQRILREHPQGKCAKLFKKLPKGFNGPRFQVEQVCFECGSKLIVLAGKGRLFELLKSDFVCEKCQLHTEKGVPDGR